MQLLYQSLLLLDCSQVIWIVRGNDWWGFDMIILCRIYLTSILAFTHSPIYKSTTTTYCHFFGFGGV
ncbi:hypothetical protein [Helicobacter bilis]|uniref:Uncharacterized protein n=1 Tax=Helicobacter bilis TaxID=37372 RepID=A0A4V6I6B3_9HELI|nr:hypothetical protein [Helicobacter bilis]MCI7412056.1 hypothetical protein [Helicobacter bilis]MDD7297566.1 hypothetical protein [Helicobacter bilis]MDY4399264.1 hypothetical protein [Helicobacter bilis]TLE09736.1 hypothetical protein LS78_001605 [Helicobacter bilis]TLE12177.1 hypothetical protein LS79_000195 [Helicobacter bilis]